MEKKDDCWTQVMILNWPIITKQSIYAVCTHLRPNSLNKLIVKLQVALQPHQIHLILLNVFFLLQSFLGPTVALKFLIFCAVVFFLSHLLFFFKWCYTLNLGLKMEVIWSCMISLQLLHSGFYSSKPNIAHFSRYSASNVVHLKNHLEIANGWGDFRNCRAI